MEIATATVYDSLKFHNPYPVGMNRAHPLEIIFKWIFICSLFLSLSCYFLKDQLPPPSYYESFSLNAPTQSPTTEALFTTDVKNQHYIIEPQFDYELYGVVVSYHDADSLIDIWHHDKWKDYINLRDLCVIWGANVRNGVYLNMNFSNDNWTCWAYWPDRTTRDRFDMTALSNNHLLVDNKSIKKALMNTEAGDYIHLKGVLASYRNPANHFFRGTSTVRTDTGNGACETIYVREFDIINKANSGIRAVYQFAKWLTILSLIGYIVIFFKATHARK